MRQKKTAMMGRRTLLAGLAGTAGLPALAQAPVAQGPRNAGFEPAFAGQTRAPEARSGVRLRIERLSGRLQNPWGIAPMPGGGYLVTERPGRMRTMAEDGRLSAPIEGLPPVAAARQGGLLDVAPSPGFARDRTVFWTYAKPMGRGRSATAAARGVLSADARSLSDVRDIFVQSPSSPTPVHYGSRIVFDRRGHVFITTGEHSTVRERRLAQDIDTTFGKIVRLTPEGAVPRDNPFVARGGPAAQVWSLGHRNVQGAAIEPGSGRLWTIEHGPRGGDELNRPRPGGNYGWPVISYGINYSGSAVGSGRAVAPGMEQPRYYWDPVIAPAGMTFYDGAMFPEWRGDLLIGSLNPGGLVRLRIAGDRVVGEERFFSGERRIRDVEVARDGSVLLLWDSPDGGVLRVSRAG